MNKILETIANDGYIILRNVLPLETIQILRNSIQHLVEDQVSVSQKILYTHETPPQDLPSMETILTQWLNPCKKGEKYSTIKAIEELRQQVNIWTGGNYILFQEYLFNKKQGQNPFSWHQDYPYWPLSTPEGFTCWLALDPVSENNGGLKLAAQSHLSGARPSIDLHSGKAQNNSGYCFNEKEYKIIRPILNSGDAILFHALLFHASGINYENSNRRAWATVWLNKNVYWDPSNAPNHFLSSKVNYGDIVEDLVK